MNEEVAKLLEFLRESMEHGAAQIPLVVEDLIRWGQFCCVLLGIGSIVFLTIAGFAVRKARCASLRNDGDTMGHWAGAAGIAGLVSLAHGAASLDYLKAFVAPRLYVLDYIASLVS